MRNVIQSSQKPYKLDISLIITDEGTGSERLHDTLVRTKLARGKARI